MSHAACCAICGEPLNGSVSRHQRPLVPRELSDGGLFDIDPLGTAGAKVALCPPCQAILGAPMLLAEDVERFAQALKLHRTLYAPAPGREDQAARARLWHRALHLGLRALVGELSERPSPVAARPEPDQLGLFVSRTARFAKIETALERGDLAHARELAVELAKRFDLPEARYLATRLPSVQERLGKAELNDLAGYAENPEGLLRSRSLTVSLAAAFRRGLHRLTAEAAERAEGGGLVRGKPAGWHWLEAGELERARASLEQSLKQGAPPGEVLVLLGNIALAQADLSGARELYRKAFAVAPGEVPVDLIADSEVASLLDEAVELDLEPPEAWVPLVGYLRGVFGLQPSPEGEGEPKAFHEALLGARRARDAASGRRAMKRIAPRLFEELREAGKL